MDYITGHATDVGRVRDHNEDNYIVLPEKGLWLVADGMGGHAAGEVASAIAVKCITGKVGEKMSLAMAIEAAHQAIIKAGRNGEGTPGMGCTIVALQMSGCDYEIAWVGDSRAYLWNGVLRPLTRDHSFVQQLIDSGAISEEEARVHPQRSVITQALGASDLKTVRVDTVQGTLCRGEQILLCSDGLTSEVEDGQIAQLLQGAESPMQAVEDLIRTANNNGGSDNITVVLVEAPANASQFRGKGDTLPMKAIELPEQKKRWGISSISRKVLLFFFIFLALALFWFGWSHFSKKTRPMGNGGTIPAGGPVLPAGSLEQDLKPKPANPDLPETVAPELKFELDNNREMAEELPEQKMPGEPAGKQFRKQ
ncbi:MAG: Stp1/IreP family PP2C-type Ser/Thr phosphatase [Syntrophotaleaceae bacterium]